MAKVLIVDDEATCVSFVKRFLEDVGHSCEIAYAPQQAIELGQTFAPDVLVTDWLFKDTRSGLDLANALREYFPMLPVIFISGLPREHLERELTDFGNWVLLEKPLDIERLIALVGGMP